jgi:hypothetical protein
MTEQIKLRPELDFQFRVFCDSLESANTQQAKELAKNAFYLYLATRQTVSLIASGDRHV